MTKIYKEKAPQVEAIEVTNVSAQFADVANMIKADSIMVDVKAGQAIFTIDDQTITVKQSQVVSITGDKVSVMDAEDFYAKYELA